MCAKHQQHDVVDLVHYLRAAAAAEYTDTQKADTAGEPQSGLVEVGDLLRGENAVDEVGEGRWSASGRSADHNVFSETSGIGNQVGVVEQRQEMQRRLAAGLQRTEHVAFTALLEVDSGRVRIRRWNRRPP